MGRGENGEGRDARRASALLHQTPAVSSLSLVDPSGKERLFVSRIGLNRINGGDDLSTNPAFVGAQSGRIWFGPVTFHEGSEPYTIVAVAGDRSAAGVAIAEVNLKFVWEVVSAIRVGQNGRAFVLDQPGRLIAHPDINMVLRANQQDQLPLRATRAAILSHRGQAAVGDVAGNPALAAIAQIPGVNWTVIVHQPLDEAFAPLYRAMWRTGALIASGAVLASLVAFWLTRQLVEPVRVLAHGAARIGAGDFRHRIELSTSDEFERLAARFNEMAAEILVSTERSERISRLKQFLSPQVAELVDRIGDDAVLEGRRVEVVALFCDLRDFTAFSTQAKPEDVIGLLRDYYSAIEEGVNKHEATLIKFTGDGAMVLVNAPVSCLDPAPRAVALANDLQAKVQPILSSWRNSGFRIGFGIGLAMGPATVGKIGTDARLDYTAIGSVVNLAARLCSIAKDSQILADQTLADALVSGEKLEMFSALSLKGFSDPVAVFSAMRADYLQREIVEADGRLNVAEDLAWQCSSHNRAIAGTPESRHPKQAPHATPP